MRPRTGHGCNFCAHWWRTGMPTMPTMPTMPHRDAGRPGSATTWRAPEQVHRLLTQAPSSEVTVDARFRLFDAVAEVFASAASARRWCSSWTTCTGPTRARSGCSSSSPATRGRAGWRSSGPTGTPTSIRPTRWPSAWPSSSATGCTSRWVGWARATWPTLVSSVGRDGPRSAGAVARLHRQSGGNPFFLRELLRLLSEGSDGASDRVADRACRARWSPAAWAGCPDATQDVLAAASVLGADFDLALLGAVDRPQSPAQLLTALDEAESARLVDRDRARGRLRLRACPGSRGALRRAGRRGPGGAAPAGRGGAGGALRRRPAGRSSPTTSSRPRSGEPDDAASSYAVRAAERELARSLAYEEAAALVRAWRPRGTEHPATPARGDLLLRCGEARLAAGDLPGARAALRAGGGAGPARRRRGTAGPGRARAGRRAGRLRGPAARPAAGRAARGGPRRARPGAVRAAGLGAGPAVGGAVVHGRRAAAPARSARRRSRWPGQVGDPAGARLRAGRPLRRHRRPGLAATTGSPSRRRSSGWDGRPATAQLELLGPPAADRGPAGGRRRRRGRRRDRSGSPGSPSGCASRSTAGTCRCGGACAP